MIPYKKCRLLNLPQEPIIRVVVACMTDALQATRGKRSFPAKRETSVKGETRGWERIKKVQTIACWTWPLLGVSSVGTMY